MTYRSFFLVDVSKQDVPLLATNVIISPRNGLFMVYKWRGDPNYLQVMG